jgi:hypothetical protein
MCPNGHEVRDGLSFCTTCGKELRPDSPEVEQTGADGSSWSGRWWWVAPVGIVAAIVAFTLVLPAISQGSDSGWKPSIEHAIGYACGVDPAALTYDLEYTGSASDADEAGSGQEVYFTTIGRWRTADGRLYVGTEIWGYDSEDLLGWRVLCKDRPAPSGEGASDFWTGEVTDKTDVMVADLNDLHDSGDLDQTFDWLPSDSISTAGSDIDE